MDLMKRTIQRLHGYFLAVASEKNFTLLPRLLAKPSRRPKPRPACST